MLMRAYGTDRLSLREGGRLVLACRVPKGWIARRDATLTSPEHPGTAVYWDEQWYEVVEIGSPGVTYVLAPWNDAHVIRIGDQYNEESERAREAAYRRMKAAEARRKLSIWLAPLVGHLPARVQEKMHSEIGTPPVALTLISTVPPILYGFVCLGWKLAERTSGVRAMPSFLFSLGILLTTESVIRIFHAVVQERPIGSLGGSIGYTVWYLLARDRSNMVSPFPTYEGLYPGARISKESTAADSGREMPREAGEVRRRFRPTGRGHDQESDRRLVRPTDRGRDQESDRRLVRPTDRGHDQVSDRGRNPTEALEVDQTSSARPSPSLYRTRKSGGTSGLSRPGTTSPLPEYVVSRSDAPSAAEDRFNFLEPFLSLLSPEEQRELQRRYAFSPIAWGRRTAITILALAGLGVLCDLAAFLVGTPGFMTVASFFVALGFAIEQAARLVALRHGPAGSVLGAVVRPFARILFEGDPTPVTEPIAPFPEPDEEGSLHGEDKDDAYVIEVGPDETDH